VGVLMLRVNERLFLRGTFSGLPVLPVLCGGVSGFASPVVNWCASPMEKSLVRRIDYVGWVSLFPD